MTYVYFMGLPSLIVWVLCTPAFALWIIFKQRHNLRAYSTRSKFGFLYNGYKQKYFYWEFLILYRKIAVAFIAVLLVTEDI